jgi:hypothetical protein
MGIPAGSITIYAGTVAPAGYLVCDGAAVNCVTYAALFQRKVSSGQLVMVLQLLTFRTEVEGGNETRPKNVYVYFIIKY